MKWVVRIFRVLLMAVFYRATRHYKVNYDANGGSPEPDSEFWTFGVSKKLTKNTFTKTGYTFSGWNTKEDGTGTDGDGTENENPDSGTNGDTSNNDEKVEDCRRLKC